MDPLHEGLEVVHVPERERFELRRNAETIGRMVAKPDGRSMAIPSLDVDPEHRGQGWATEFALRALAMLRAQGMTPVASCPFVKWVIETREPEASR